MPIAQSKHFIPKHVREYQGDKIVLRKMKLVDYFRWINTIFYRISYIDYNKWIKLKLRRKR